MSKFRTAALLALLAAGLLASACTDRPEAPDESDVVVTIHDGYELQGDPKSVIEYPGNDQIFSGNVVGRESPRKVSLASPSGNKVEYIYTPVIVEVDHVFKGDRAILGKRVPVRVIGGQVGKEKTVSEVNPAPVAYRDGMKLYLFTQGFLDVGDGLRAATPNFTFGRDEAGNAYNLHNPELKTSDDSFFMQLSEWVAFNN